MKGEIHMAEEKQLEQYIMLPNVYHCSPFKNGKQFTFISNESGIPSVWKGDLSGGAARYGYYADRVLAIHHAPSNRMSIVEMDTDGDEKSQLYIQRYNYDEVEKLVYAPTFFHKFGGWSPDETKVCFTSNRREPGYFDLFTINVETKEMKTVFSFDGICEPICWFKDGRHILIRVNETNVEQTLYAVDTYTGEKRTIGDPSQLAAYDDIRLTKDGEGAYLLTNFDNEMMYIAYVNFSDPSKVQKVYANPEWDIETLTFDEDETMLAFTVNKGGFSLLQYFHIKTNTVETVETLPLSVIDSLHWLDHQTLLFTLRSATIPGDIWCYNLGNDSLKRLTEVSRAADIEDELISPILHSFSSFDDIQIPYFLYAKEETENKPVVVYVHGGPESQIRATYNPVIQYLAANGFVVVAPNVRGSKGYGRTFIKLDDGVRRLDAVKDLACLAEHLTTVHAVDPERIGVVGRSYGGFMVLASLTHYPEIWRAGVNIVGISHFTTFLENTGSWRRRLRECEYGTLADHRDFFEEISPLRLAKNIQAPLLVFHGENDTRVPVSEAEQLVAGMRKRGQSVEFTVFEDEGHQTEKFENVLTMHGETIRFFQKELNES